MKNSFIFLCAVLMVFGMTQLAAAFAVNIYTDRASWEGAVGGSFLEETFSDALLNPEIGVVSSVGVVDTTIIGVDGNLGVWSDQVAAPSQTTTFDFIPDITAFGGNWNLAGPTGPGTGIAVTLLDGSIVSLGQISRFLDFDFWGFVTDVAFTSVLLTEGTQASGVETFYLDNMVYAPVPEPGTFLLLGCGLAGIALYTRKRKSA